MFRTHFAGLRALTHQEPDPLGHVQLTGTTVKPLEAIVTATNEIDACLCQEDLPDEFSRLAASSPSSDFTLSVVVYSGLVPTRDEDGVMCPLMLRRHLVVPAFGSASGSGKYSSLS
jgi:hypothetical protein